MFRQTLPRKAAVLLGIAAVAAAVAITGCFADEASNGSVEPTEPSPVVTPVPPDPAELAEKDAKVMAIVHQDKAIKAMLAGREEGRDYWIQIGYVYEHREAANTGEKPIAMVHFFFDPPISSEGDFPVIVSDPCSGRRGPDERLDPDDPCMNEPKEYGRVHGGPVDAQHVTAQVDLRRGEVVEVFQSPVAPATIEDIKESYGQ